VGEVPPVADIRELRGRHFVVEQGGRWLRVAQFVSVEAILEVPDMTFNDAPKWMYRRPFYYS
jgi:hypothetical protein